MKFPKPLTIAGCRVPFFKKLAAAPLSPAAGAWGHRPSQRGIALVITLILLSVTLFMAVAFLAISRRERGSVVTETAGVTARLAADAALASAQAQILATVLQTTNPFNFGLRVSTNYINANGFISSLANLTNVNYDYYSNGNSPLSSADFEQNVANLYYLPRPPVFVNDRTSGSNEFRFYLDLNRNAVFDANGAVPENNGLGLTGLTNSEVGDPEWIGVLERPDAPHGPNNKFLSRYAFIALPAGNTLDLNAIHNEVYNSGLGSADGFFRNQGVGSWELNLAAFLADLNTNEWGTVFSPYNYSRWSGYNNSGLSFDDARALLAYRYAANYNTLASFSTLFPYYPTTGGPVDMFPFGSLLTSPSVVPFHNFTLATLNTPWPGADNTNHYFGLPSDLFDTAKTQIGLGASAGFTGHLMDASTNLFGGSAVSTYDRYTFYRMLAQLGTDSAPETGKLNVNYVNVDSGGSIVPNLQTNGVAWTPLQFFTNAADRMLRAYTTQWFQKNPSNYLATYYGITNVSYSYTDASGTRINDIHGLGLTNVPFFGLTNEIPSFGVTAIPVWMNGSFLYRPAVQRVLQLAANIYDATTNRAGTSGKNYPTVLRPTFYKESGSGFTNVFVNGYEEVSSLPGLIAANSGNAPLDPPIDVADLSDGITSGLGVNRHNVYGVPWIIGAKKGFPSFNEFSLESVVTVTRKLQLVRTNDATGGIAGGLPMRVTRTNQMYFFSITNHLGVEFWNSYSNAYTSAGAGTELVVRDVLYTVLTNAVRTWPAVPSPVYLSPITNVGMVWPGAWVNGSIVGGSFKLPLGSRGTPEAFLPASVYSFGTADFVGVNSAYEDYAPMNLPHFGLLLTNRLQVFLLENGHVIDYAHFNGPETRRDLNAELADPSSTGAPAYLWSTNVTSAQVPFGTINQVNVSAGIATLVVPQNGGNWQTPAGLPQSLRGKAGAIEAYFKGFLSPNSLYSFGGKSYTNTEYSVQAPYTPTRTLVSYTSWQANDPLVHYLGSDLNYSGAEPSSALSTGLTKWNGTSPDILPGLGNLNERYQPWGKVHSDAGADNNPHNSSLKDPLVRQSDDWDFPTFKLPAVGWLGRVHRGTPWQTVYLKATNLLSTSGISTWTNWTGNRNRFDATNAAPVQDRLLFDVFTTALNDNATRGQLPINVAAAGTNNSAAGLAAWSALFSGIAVPTNRAGGYAVISPAGGDVANSPLGQIVANINGQRAVFTNLDGVGGSFEHVGDILSVANLTQNSPFLSGQNITNGITDALMEWLPQQTLSLMRVGAQPRFVIYSYGQTLAPSPNGIVTRGTYPGMITNYQVTAETVTRSVVRVEGAPTNAHAVVESYNILPPD